MGKHRSGHSYQEFPILNVARRCGLVLNDRTLEWEEVEASCPFCGDHGPGKHHLFLNTTRNIFRCVLCGEKGNSVSLYAKMEGVSNRQAFRALSVDSVLYRFPQQPRHKNRRNGSPAPWPSGTMSTMICSCTWSSPPSTKPIFWLGD